MRLDNDLRPGQRPQCQQGRSGQPDSDPGLSQLMEKSENFCKVLVSKGIREWSKTESDD